MMGPPCEAKRFSCLIISTIKVVKFFISFYINEKEVSWEIIGLKKKLKLNNIYK